jgi:hypothetical protein
MLRPAHVALKRDLQSQRRFGMRLILWAQSVVDSVDVFETAQTSSLGLDRCYIFDCRGTIKGWSATCGEFRSHTHSHTSSIVLYTPIYRS